MKKLGKIGYWMCLSMIFTLVLSALLTIAWDYKPDLRSVLYWIISFIVVIVCKPISNKILKQ